MSEAGVESRRNINAQTNQSADRRVFHQNNSTISDLEALRHESKGRPRVRYVDRFRQHSLQTGFEFQVNPLSFYRASICRPQVMTALTTWGEQVIYPVNKIVFLPCSPRRTLLVFRATLTRADRHQCTCQVFKFLHRRRSGRLQRSCVGKCDS